MRTPLSCLLVLGTLLGATGARAADNPKYNVYTFRPSPHAGDLLGIETSHAPKAWEYAGGLFFTWNSRPLTLVAPGGGDIAALVSRQVVADLFANIGILNFLSLGMNVPLMLQSSGDPAPAKYGLTQVDGFSLGDIRVSLKGILVDGKGDGFGVALSEDLGLPTASATHFAGDQGVVSTTLLIGDFARAGWRIAANVGFRARSTVEILGREIGNELLYGLGGVAPVVCGKVEVIGTIDGRTAAGSPFASQYDNALDGAAGLRLRFGDIAVTAAGGGGVLSGSGSPTWRADVGVSLLPQVKGACVVDTDKDGVPDEQDKCPAIAGLATLHGCPDKDGDGLADGEDRCPDQAGPAALKGCPDGDGDGFADPDDRCPKVAGPDKGCPIPDGDHDGVPDDKDRCPTVRGPQHLGGCPDKDDDGIVDLDDKCPDKLGVKELNGCPLPDQDGDGIPDRDDKCPDVPGVPAKQGCPEQRVVITKEKIAIMEVIFFETGKDKIKKESYSLLDEIAKIVKDHPEIKRFRVEGHTDNVGNAKKNLTLSDKRAKAVATYLKGKGVAASRMEAKGYGDTQPIADNGTDEGKAKNRRVEFKILERADK